MRFAPFALAPLLLLLAACHASSDSTAPGPVLSPIASERTPALAPGDPLYERCEGTAFANACSADADCFIGGCSGEVCTADPNVNSTCVAVPWPPDSVACGCVDGLCTWYLGRP